MIGQYRGTHIRFAYPEGWTIDETQSADGLTINLQSPGLMFVFVTLFDRPVSPDTVAEEALETMREQYPNLESLPAQETIAHLPAVGHDVSFFCLDLTNTCWIRAFAAGPRTVLMFGQTEDSELEVNAQVFRAICASVELPRLVPD